MEVSAIAFEKGQTYKEMGLLAEAVSEFEKTLADESLKFRASREIASCLLSMGKPEQAERVLITVLLTLAVPKTDRLKIYSDLAKIYEREGRPESALERYVQIFYEDSGFMPDIREKIEQLQKEVGIPALTKDIEGPGLAATISASAKDATGTGGSSEEDGNGDEEQKQRVKMSNPVEYSFDQISWSTGYSTDISRGGMFVITYAPIPIGSVVFLRFNLPEQTSTGELEVIGQAVREETKRHGDDGVLGMGVKFISMEERQRASLDKFIRDQAADDQADNGRDEKIRFQCDYCGRMISVQASGSGKYGTCACGKPVFVPYAVHTPTSENPLRGLTLAGCRIDSVIGKGSAATVYKGHHLALDIPVAVKVLHQAQRESQSEMAKRFLKEARVIARINHANIVGVMNAGEENDHSFIVMQFVAGGSLGDALNRGIQMSINDFIKVFVDICSALTAAHQHAVVHGDIKPANIMLTSGGKAMLVDFGLVKDVRKYTDEQDSGMTMGTPLYMSPEQVKGETAVDFRSDIYSLGATMFHAVAGRPPFQAFTYLEVIRKHLKEPPKPLYEVRPDIPASISDIILKALDKKPENRFQKAEDVKKALLGVSRNLAIEKFKPLSKKLLQRSLKSLAPEDRPGSQTN